MPLTNKAMIRANFQTIKRYDHFANNNGLNTVNKFAKVRTLY